MMIDFARDGQTKPTIVNQAINNLPDSALNC